MILILYAFSSRPLLPMMARASSKGGQATWPFPAETGAQIQHKNPTPAMDGRSVTL